ncbi:MAG TPA: hypothetical protein DCR93_05095 [Cytophagales bacterium]|nr:hypothetical protein [Cytophagales bacterium]HAP58892.1 hypothetical protein [Cytophagales bacterium]
MGLLSNLYKSKERRQIERAKAGSLIIPSPQENFMLYYYNRLGEMEKRNSFLGMVQYIDHQKIDAEQQADSQEKLRRLSIVCALYEKLETLVNKDPEQTIVIRLKEQSHEAYNNFSVELGNRQIQRWKEQENNRFLENLRQQKAKGISYAKRAYAIPGAPVDWLLRGHLWYENNMEGGHKWHKNKYDVVEYGDHLSSYYDLAFYSPLSGITIGHSSDVVSPYFAVFLPEKNQQIQTFPSELIFGELIERIESHIQKN